MVRLWGALWFWRSWLCLGCLSVKVWIDFIRAWVEGFHVPNYHLFMMCHLTLCLLLGICFRLFLLLQISSMSFRATFSPETFLKPVWFTLVFFCPFLLEAWNQRNISFSSDSFWRKEAAIFLIPPSCKVLQSARSVWIWYFGVGCFSHLMLTLVFTLRPPLLLTSPAWPHARRAFFKLQVIKMAMKYI